MTSLYYGSTISEWQQTNDGKENAKKQYVYINKKTTLHVHHAICTFLFRRCTTTTWNVLISRARSMA